MSVFVCSCVCLRAYLRNYTMAVARPSSGGVAICYVVPDMDDVTRTASDVARRSCDGGIDRAIHA